MSQPSTLREMGVVEEFEFCAEHIKNNWDTLKEEDPEKEGKKKWPVTFFVDRSEWNGAVYPSFAEKYKQYGERTNCSTKQADLIRSIAEDWGFGGEGPEQQVMVSETSGEEVPF